MIKRKLKSVFIVLFSNISSQRWVYKSLVISYFRILIILTVKVKQRVNMCCLVDKMITVI